MNLNKLFLIAACVIGSGTVGAVENVNLFYSNSIPVCKSNTLDAAQIELQVARESILAQSQQLCDHGYFFPGRVSVFTVSQNLCDELVVEVEAMCEKF